MSGEAVRTVARKELTEFRRDGRILALLGLTVTLLLVAFAGPRLNKLIAIVAVFSTPGYLGRDRGVRYRRRSDGFRFPSQ